MFTKKFSFAFVASFLFILFAFPSLSAADFSNEFSKCPTTNPGKTADCATFGPTYRWITGLTCKTPDASEIQKVAPTTLTGTVWNPSCNNTWVCPSGQITCGNACQAPYTAVCSNGGVRNACTNACSCPANQILNASDNCVPYSGASAPLSLDANNKVTIGSTVNGDACAADSVLKFTSGVWGCASIVSMVGVTGATGATGSTGATLGTTPGSGITVNSAGKISLVDCTAGQILKYKAAAGLNPAGWACADMTGGSGSSSGGLGVFVGYAPSQNGVAYDTYVSEQVNGYQAMNVKCDQGPVADYSDPTVPNKANMGAHVCTAAEIINSYNTNSYAISRYGIVNKTGIINNGPPGYEVFANDCNGWKATGATYYGSPAYASVWSFDKKAGYLASCGDIFNKASVKLACCK